MQSIISIIVPCFNQAKYLDECLQSVLEQTFENWECIIVNDGSPDHTAEIAAAWVAKDSRFRYIYKHNGGLSSARNAGIEVAVGEYILPLDADDKIANEYLQFGKEAFLQDEKLKVVYSRARKFGQENKEWILKPYSLANLLLGNMIFCSALFRKTDWENVDGYDENMIYGYEDWEFWISILKNGGKVLKFDEVYFFYRIKKDSMLVKISPEKDKYLYDYVSKKHTDTYISIYGNFPEFHRQLQVNKNNYFELLKSEKFVINLFCKTFFGFQPFNNCKIPV